MHLPQFFFLFVYIVVPQEEGREFIKAFTEQLTETPPRETADGKHIAKLGEFHYLHRRRVDTEDATVLGCSL
jgi:hypothetical protein